MKRSKYDGQTSLLLAARDGGEAHAQGCGERHVIDERGPMERHRPSLVGAMLVLAFASACTGSSSNASDAATAIDVGRVALEAALPADDVHPLDVAQTPPVDVLNDTPEADVATCDDGFTRCAALDLCVDLAHDPHHCGSCSRDCTMLAGVDPARAFCSSGVCNITSACTAGRAHCTSDLLNGCESDLTSAATCGGCATRCGDPTPLCTPAEGDGGVERTCTSGCTAPTPSRCHGACTDTTTDPANCGSCGHACPADAHGTVTCVTGACHTECANGYNACDGHCVLPTDVTHCGPSCTPCPTPEGTVASCDGTACHAECMSGRGNCDAFLDCETDLLTNRAHCGSCGVSCPGSQFCDQGACQLSPPVSCTRARTTYGCGALSLPGGTFTMGDDADTGDYNQHPAQPSITVSGFAIDQYEVTVERFRQFFLAGMPAPGPVLYPNGTALTIPGNVEEPRTTAASSGYCNWTRLASATTRNSHPINCVNAATAQAFCVWDGGRLPTEAEWEYAARGRTASGLPVPRRFPWGNNDATCGLAQASDCVHGSGPSTITVSDTSEFGGLRGLAGNVDEWTADQMAFLSDTNCWNGLPRTNPLCASAAVPLSGTLRMARGGSAFNTLNWTRATARPWVTDFPYAGMRCVR